MKNQIKFISYGVHMLKKNNFILDLIIITLTFISFSCIYQPGKTISMGLTICAKETVESEIVKVTDVTKEFITEEETTQKKYKGLSGVSCSLRNDNINDGKILAYTKSDSEGVVVFTFCDDESSCTNNAVYYLPDLDTELSAQTNGTSEFYIVINDTEMSGYEPKYDTLKQTCATPDIYNESIYLELEKSKAE